MQRRSGSRGRAGGRWGRTRALSGLEGALGWPPAWLLQEGRGEGVLSSVPGTGPWEWPELHQRGSDGTPGAAPAPKGRPGPGTGVPERRPVPSELKRLRDKAQRLTSAFGQPRRGQAAGPSDRGVSLPTKPSVLFIVYSIETVNAYCLDKHNPKGRNDSLKYPCRLCVYHSALHLSKGCKNSTLHSLFVQCSF